MSKWMWQPTPRKVDLQLESGEYFLSQEQKAAKKAEERQAAQAAGVAATQAKRQKRFEAPKEGGVSAASAPAASSSADAAGGVMQLASKLRAKAARPAKSQVEHDEEAATAMAAARDAERKRLLPDAKKTKRKRKET